MARKKNSEKELRSRKLVDRQAGSGAFRHDILHFFARVFAGTVGQIRDSSRSVDPRATGTMIGSWPQQLARRIVTITA